ncbi:MAG: 16S rRNA (uracil(1498)-N(3))-methyltransferase [Acidimicrobiia bacterium]|nr:16S rRNA (uracil(1498)-N(3))-methyltransferase [Acidimicrobiia bacterium]
MDRSAGPSGREGPHAFVTDLEHPELTTEDEHHLGRVLRLRPGDPLTLSDGRGAWRAARFGSPPEIDGEVVEVPAPSPPITIAFALVKGERPEWTVQKLTELGVDVIRPFIASRSVVRWTDEKMERSTERWRHIAREASMQSRRCRLPEVHPPCTFAAVAALDGAALAERDGAPLDLAHPVVLVGPEGGWADEERALSLPEVRLGPQVLRAETAAIAAGALLAAQRLGGPGHAS